MASTVKVLLAALTPTNAVVAQAADIGTAVWSTTGGAASVNLRSAAPYQYVVTNQQAVTPAAYKTGYVARVAGHPGAVTTTNLMQTSPPVAYNRKYVAVTAAQPALAAQVRTVATKVPALAAQVRTVAQMPALAAQVRAVANVPTLAAQMRAVANVPTLAAVRQVRAPVARGLTATPVRAAVTTVTRIAQQPAIALHATVRTRTRVSTTTVPIQWAHKLDIAAAAPSKEQKTDTRTPLADNELVRSELLLEGEEQKNTIDVNQPQQGEASGNSFTAAADGYGNEISTNVNTANIYEQLGVDAAQQEGLCPPTDMLAGQDEVKTIDLAQSASAGGEIGSSGEFMEGDDSNSDPFKLSSSEGSNVGEGSSQNSVTAAAVEPQSQQQPEQEDIQQSFSSIQSEAHRASEELRQRVDDFFADFHMTMNRRLEDMARSWRAFGFEQPEFEFPTMTEDTLPTGTETETVPVLDAQLDSSEGEKEQVSFEDMMLAVEEALQPAADESPVREAAEIPLEIEEETPALDSVELSTPSSSASSETVAVEAALQEAVSSVVPTEADVLPLSVESASSGHHGKWGSQLHQRLGELSVSLESHEPEAPISDIADADTLNLTPQGSVAPIAPQGQVVAVN